MQITLDDGLSPLARGTENTFLKLAAFLRFIPARAGNRDLQKRLTASHPVYPRSRGEQRTFTPTGRSSNGLSPLARGTVMDALEQATPMRFIPARAGNRLEGALASGKLTVYPRSRGEQWSASMTNASTLGLSPLARGTGKKKVCVFLVIRFIPARAGNRTGRRRRSATNSVYPRSRGEQVAHLAVIAGKFGLSPLARGTGWAFSLGKTKGRFIPARAGNSR